MILFTRNDQKVPLIIWVLKKKIRKQKQKLSDTEKT